MLPRFLLDTHILIRWINEPRRLSREQARVLRAAVRRLEPVAISPMSLLEVATLHSEGKIRLKCTLGEFFAKVRGGPEVQLLPVTEEIAEDVALLRLLKDPADKAIAATARVHGLQLITSDRRIIDSGLVRTVE